MRLIVRTDMLKARGWWGPAHGGTHVARAPHREAESIRIGAGYDAALSSPQGDKYDLLTRVTPEEMEAVAVSRGGWKGIGDITVKGKGFGLVKFIWRHGERSNKPPQYQIAKEDVMAFPGVIRDYEPSLDSRPGSPGREWRVVRAHPLYGNRAIVYADSVKDGGRHLVSVYVQQPDRPGTEIPFSKKKAEASAESPGKRLDAHTEDTATGFLHPPGQSASATSTIPDSKTGSMRKAMPARILFLKGYHHAA